MPASSLRQERISTRWMRTGSAPSRLPRTEAISTALWGGTAIDVDLWSLAMEADANTLATVLDRMEVDVNLLDAYGQTLLYYAVAENDDPDAIRALVRSGVEIDHRDTYGWTALMHAVRDHPEPSIVRLLIELGSDLDLQNERGMTALMIAAEHDRPDMARVLLDAGADATVCTHGEVRRCSVAEFGMYISGRSGYVASDYAVISGSPETLELLLRHDPTATDWLRLLSLAMLGNPDPAMMRYLGELPITPDSETLVREAFIGDPNVYRVLRLAVWLRLADKIVLLHEWGVDLNAGSHTIHGTPLMRAVQVDWSEGIDLLLDLGADPLAEDNRGKTALDYVRDPLDEATYQRLLSVSSP